MRDDDMHVSKIETAQALQQTDNWVQSIYDFEADASLYVNVSVPFIANHERLTIQFAEYIC